MVREMIILARESRALTQLELADKLGISNANLSKIERGDINVSEETVAAIAGATNYPASFFFQTNEIFPDHLVYRKRDKVAQKALTLIDAKINVIKFQLKVFIDTLGIPNPKLPIMELSEGITPAMAATFVRKTWKLQTPVISNLVEALERNGIAIHSFDFESERVDSRCLVIDNKYPVIIFNRAMLGDRQRFSLAYQLGHLIMHSYFNVDWNRDVSHEANLFASEFLMPESEIRSDFEDGITLSKLSDLKKKWKVSMISLLYRADDLGYLTANQKRYLLQQFNEYKIRRREPPDLDVSSESPSLITNWIAVLRNQRQLDLNAIASLIHVNQDEFTKLYF